MNTKAWLLSNNLELALRRDNISDRKRRLFAVACCRSIKPIIGNGAFFDAVEAAEMFADGKISKKELYVKHSACFEARSRMVDRVTHIWHAQTACEYVSDPSYDLVANVPYHVCQSLAYINPNSPNFVKIYKINQAELVGLYRHFTYPAVTNTPYPRTVVQLAEQFYDGDTSVLNALCDSLLDGGYEVEAAHFRDTDYHPKGCGLLDGITSKL